MGSGARFADLSTPCALVDLERVSANCCAMARRADRLGVRLRPHVKTHKTVELARRQVAHGEPALTVSTLAEAKFFAHNGFSDITYAVPLAPQRLPEVIQLAKQVERLTILVDHSATLEAVRACAAATGQRLAVMLEVDCGAHRCGVDPTDPAAVVLARRLVGCPEVEFRGLLTHAGHAYACTNTAEVARVAAQERDVITALAQRLRQRGVGVPEVSIGSTPTLSTIDHLTGVTEVRPGNYVFFDAFQAAIGVCSLADCAFSVLATVIGCYPERRALVIDAGALALSKDPGPVHVHPACGFGVVCTVDDCLPIPGLRLASLTQEHGTVLAESAAIVAAHLPGSRLRIIPNHSCLTAACFDTYYGVLGGQVRDVFHPCRGW